MTTVFIAGSISIGRLHARVKERLENIVSSNFKIIVGDADGVDASVQEFLRDTSATGVTVYCSGDRPRNNVANWPVKNIHPDAPRGSRAYFTAKDLEMARASDLGFMIWDCKSTGTLSNVIELLKENKKSLVFINKNKNFVTVSDVSSLEAMLNFMSSHAKAKAEEKIDLSSRIASLDQPQLVFSM